MGRGRIVLYHHVSPDPVNPFYVTPARLRDQIRSIRQRGYTITDLPAILRGERDSVVLTFDDAYENVFEHALPVLSDEGVTATIFVPTNLVGGMNTYDSLVPLTAWRAERIMSWRQLREVRAMGWSVQSHGCSHLPMCNLLADHVQDEFARSKHTLEDRLGERVFAYAYPYGQPPERSRAGDWEDVLVGCGYTMALLASGGETDAPPDDPLQVRRILVTESVQPVPAVRGAVAGIAPVAGGRHHEEPERPGVA